MKLYYFYGTMNSGKSLNLLAKAHQFEEAGSKVLLIKPSLDTRTSSTIKSRIGVEKECVVVDKNQDIEVLVLSEYKDKDVIFVDESQFLEVEQIDQLWRLSRRGIRVFCYGLRTSFMNTLFPASARLIVAADKMIELVSKCQHCNNKASTHNKIGGNSSISKEVGDVNDSNNSATYESVCQECYIGYKEF